jgi:hypothetical protein
MDDQSNPVSNVPPAKPGTPGPLDAGWVFFFLDPFLTWLFVPPSRQSRVISRVPCGFAWCGKTFTRSTDLKRHVDTVHFPKNWFWCPIPNCNRSFDCASPKPFPRKDKRNAHCRKVHEIEVADSAAFETHLAQESIQLPQEFGDSFTASIDDLQFTGFTGYIPNTQFPQQLDDIFTADGNAFEFSGDVDNGQVSQELVDAFMADVCDFQGAI